MRPESPLITQVGRESVVPCNVTTCREKNVVIFAQVENATDVITGPVAPVVRIFTKIEDFSPQGEGLGDFTLPQPAQLPEVLVAPAWINPVTTSAISCPWPPALLSPDRKEQRHVAAPETAVAVARRYMHEGEDTNLRNRLALMNETVFYPHLRIPKAIHGWSAVEMDKGKRDKEMQLDIRYRAVVELEMGQGPFLPVLVVRVLGCDIEFPVPVLNSFGVIRDEWWPGPGSRGDKDNQEEKGCKNGHQKSMVKANGS